MLCWCLEFLCQCQVLQLLGRDLWHGPTLEHAYRCHLLRLLLQCLLLLVLLLLSALFLRIHSIQHGLRLHVSHRRRGQLRVVHLRAIRLQNLL